MKVGDKVVFQGITQVIVKIEGDAIRIRQVRRNYGGQYWHTVTADRLQPYEAKAKVSAHAKTCQVCARAIHAATGRIAHHGYQRPGDGQQTASCFGALALPFEVSRDRLGEWLEVLKRDIERCRANVADQRRPRRPRRVPGISLPL